MLRVMFHFCSVSVRFVSVRLVSFLFAPFRFISFRFGMLCVVLVRFLQFWCTPICFVLILDLFCFRRLPCVSYTLTLRLVTFRVFLFFVQFFLACPAMSQSCSLTVVSPTNSCFSAKSTPTVVLWCPEKKSCTYLRRSQQRW